MATPQERLLAKVRVDDAGCWIWQGATAGQRRNYSAFYFEGRLTSGHRASYRLFVGPIPDGLEIDHVCRVTLCVNPEHLEAVTHAENDRRRVLATPACQRGHQYDEANTYMRPDGRGRDCRRCRADASARLRSRRAQPELTR